MKQDFFDWLNVSAEVAARRLLGCELVCDVDGQEVRVRIVETEAYDQDDEASHAFRGPTARNEAMFLGAGHLYVYFTYGMHHCCNIVCGPAGYGSGVLIRAVEPLQGTDTIELRRGVQGVNTTNGPAKVCAALSIDRSLGGHDLSRPPVRLLQKPPLKDDEITVTTRIGISKAKELPRRFYVTSSPYVSKR